MGLVKKADMSVNMNESILRLQVRKEKKRKTKWTYEKYSKEKLGRDIEEFFFRGKGEANKVHLFIYCNILLD